MANCEVVVTPMNINEKLCHDDGAEKENVKQSRSLAGSLNYLSHKKLNISFSVGVVSRFIHNPRKLYLEDAKKILRYVARIAENGIQYSKHEDRKYKLGFIFNLRSGAISWSSKK
ncbi:integrase [Gossypium australe]|uniref:Integrase n=1 Tax=Gossypium australe TaxID=47621 RepID=A0A5B6VQ95_9ROSI|nr:integrase [Gossypium australe]